MKKSILLARIETEDISFIPYGLLYVASALLKQGYTVHIIHCRDSELDIFQNALDKYKEDLLFVGFSCITSSHILSTLEASSLVKKKGIPVIWGGIHPTMQPELCLNEKNVDFVIIGEGEETVCAVADALERNGRTFSSMYGLGFKDGDKLIINPPEKFVDDIDKYFPAYDLIDLTKYFQKKFNQERVLPIISSRGCPYRCGFCYVSTFYKSKWRAHSISFVLRQVEYLKKKYDIDGLYWHDDNFFVDMERGRKLIEQINLPSFGEVRADYITPDFVKWVKETKLGNIYVGVESGSDRILDFIHKGQKKAAVVNAVQRLKGSGIIIDLSFIVGFPTETKKERKETLRFIGELKKINPNIGLELKIYTPYAGTPLWPLALRAGLNPPKSNKEWSQVNRFKCILPWENSPKLESLCRKIQPFFKAYCNKQNLVWVLFGWLQKMRWRYSLFIWPIEFIIVDWYIRVRSKIILLLNIFKKHLI